ncbi:MAG: type I-E CRISPR-associated protein Cas7/Cse4/CasC, partial [Jatrophihabitantaceae bacterium]
MSRTIIDIHVLQTVPPSNLNRDDTGSPKTAQYGGVRRARVSSQAWKRSTRAAFPSMLDASELGVRTKRIIELVSAEIKRIDAGLAEHADDYAKQTLELAGFKFAAPKKGEIPESSALTFLSAAQIGALADAAVKSAGAGEGNFDTALKELNVKAIADQKHSIDIALFGRMVADLPSFNVDAAAQVA